MAMGRREARGFSLGLPMRALTGAGPPKGAAEAAGVPIVGVQTSGFAVIMLIAASPDAASDEFGMLAITAMAQDI